MICANPNRLKPRDFCKNPCKVTPSSSDFIARKKADTTCMRSTRREASMQAWISVWEASTDQSPIYLTRAQNAFGCLSHVGNVLGNASQLHQSQANPGGCVFGSLPSQKCVGPQAPGARMKRSRPTSVSEHPAQRPRGFRQHSLKRQPGRHLCAGGSSVTQLLLLWLLPDRSITPI